MNNRKNDSAPISLIEFIDIAPSSIETDNSDEEATGSIKNKSTKE